jgi:ATP-dependent Lon protease
MSVAPLAQPLRDALGALPVFPLPRLIFFPGTMLPLHIFEPRYRAMVVHCLATHRAMAVATLLEGPLDDHGNPPFASVAGAGVIVDHEELPDGRFNILLRGDARVRLDELPFLPPYRRARAEVLDDLPGEIRAHDATALRSLIRSFVTEFRVRNPGFEFELEEAPLELQLYPIASQLIASPEARLQLLQERSPSERCLRLIEQLAAQRAILRQQPGAQRVLN